MKPILKITKQMIKYNLFLAIGVLVFVASVDAGMLDNPSPRSATKKKDNEYSRPGQLRTKLSAAGAYATQNSQAILPDHLQRDPSEIKANDRANKAEMTNVVDYEIKDPVQSKLEGTPQAQDLGLKNTYTMQTQIGSKEYIEVTSSGVSLRDATTRRSGEIYPIQFKDTDVFMAYTKQGAMKKLVAKGLTNSKAQSMVSAVGEARRYFILEDETSNGDVVLTTDRLATKLIPEVHVSGKYPVIVLSEFISRLKAAEANNNSIEFKETNSPKLFVKTVLESFNLQSFEHAYRSKNGSGRTAIRQELIKAKSQVTNSELTWQQYRNVYRAEAYLQVINELSK